MEDKNISIQKQLIIDMLRHLEIIVPSLDRIGSCHADLPREEFDKLSSEFLINWNVFRRLSFIRHKLSELIDYDELENLFDRVPSWSLNNQKPPEEEIEL